MREVDEMTLDDVTLQIIQSSLSYACEEMGLALRNSAYSPNIKERMDHSAAIFDRQGRMLAQAEHIPVHLGSLPWGMRKTLERCRLDGPRLRPGTMVMANNPYLTGTHLNDLTLVAPIYASGELVGFAVNKAHHADVGGRVPGSISMDAKTLFEEGLVVDPRYLVENNQLVQEALSDFSSASRMPGERMGDLRAQVAANFTGVRRVREVIAKYGLSTFREAGEGAFRHSERMMRARLSSIREGGYEASEVLEGPAGHDMRLRLSMRVEGGAVKVDYEGTDPEVDYPLNAVFGVTLSGVFYVVRSLTGDDIPANHGAFVPVEVSAPPGTVLNPTFPHPVGGGNVETSQRNADLVFRAFAKALPGAVPAAAGGSMNNVMVGGIRRGKGWAFYETIGVGLGGRAGADGIDGIQCNMTNTMNTPVEQVERYLPLMVTRYEFREGSGGSGRHRGGCGIVRTYKALASGTRFTVLADRERHRPWGLRGGGPGAGTEVFIVRRGRRARVGAKGTYVLGRGDEVEVRTAGGGGYGSPARRERSLEEKDVKDGLVSARLTIDHPWKGPAALLNSPHKQGLRGPHAWDSENHSADGREAR